MNKNTSTENIWDESFDGKSTQKEVEQHQAVSKAKQKAPTKAAPPQSLNSIQFDLDGLMTDFPTAKELERFVFDETGIVLNLKGRANKLKYQVAMDVLNGEEVDQVFLGNNNPYIDKTELVPVEDLKAKPERDPNLPPRTKLQNSFYSPMIPHPDDTMRAMDKKVDMVFRKYENGMISYEIQGPLEQIPHGEKINKYGKVVPEIIKWIDPRTGEQIAVREDGTLTPQGKKLRALMLTKKVNNTNQWDMWVDREFISTGDFDMNDVWN